MTLSLLLCALLALIFYFIFKYKKIHCKFDAFGVKYVKGVPVFGNVWSTLLSSKSVNGNFEDVYKEFPDERYFGYIEGNTPVIYVRDPDLMKDIVIKDFDHFVNKKIFFPSQINSMLANSLVSVSGNEWKKQRQKLSQAFTVSKMRHVLVAADEIAKEIIVSLKEKSPELDIGHVMYEYVTQTTMYAAFGIRNLTNSEKKALALNITYLDRVLYFFAVQYPIFGYIIKFFGMGVISSAFENCFRTLILDAIEHRKKNNYVVQDYLQTLADVSDEWPSDAVTGQALFAYLASSDTGGNLLALCCHELALSPRAEDKLYQEIRKHKEIEGPLTYDNLGGLKYLDCVIDEVLRKWSATMVMVRVCTKPYWLPPPRKGGKPYLVEPGDMIFNAINPVHMDPLYFPDPETFDPERFSDQNRHNIKPGTYAPFGLGPRSCLGWRYMKIVMKVIMYHTVLNFHIWRCDKTMDPIRCTSDEFSVRCENGSWVRLEARE